MREPPKGIWKEIPGNYHEAGQENAKYARAHYQYQGQMCEEFKIPLFHYTLTSYPYPNALCFVLMSPLLSSGKTGKNKRVNVSKPFTGMSLHGTKQMNC